MTAQLIAFSLLLLLGAASRPAYIGLTALERKIGLTAVTVIFDFFAAGIAVAAAAVIIFFFANGVFMPFMPLAAVVGYCAVATFF